MPAPLIQASQLTLEFLGEIQVDEWLELTGETPRGRLLGKFSSSVLVEGLPRAAFEDEIDVFRAGFRRAAGNTVASQLAILQSTG